LTINVLVFVSLMAHTDMFGGSSLWLAYPVLDGFY